jgi:hypothetical protein
LNGKLLSSWGTTGTLPGTFDGIHGFHVDPDGNLWVAENFNGRVQKLRPKLGANKALLFGPPMPLKGKPRS